MNYVYIQNSDTAGKVDILTKEPGCHADHYMTVPADEADHWAREAANQYKDVAKVIDYRRG